MDTGSQIREGVTIKLTINGVSQTLDVQPWVTLLDLLRDST